MINTDAYEVLFTVNQMNLRFPPLNRHQSNLKNILCVLLQPVEATDDAFWDQFWADISTSVQDVFALVPAAEIRAVREESPSNLATLCYKVSSCIQAGGCVYHPQCCIWLLWS